MDGSSCALGGVRPVELLQKGWNAYYLLLVRLVLVVHFPVNDWTLRSVAYSLHDGCLASIGTSYNEDSERYLWDLTKRCCRTGDLVCHVSWIWEARAADRFEPPINTAHTFLLW